MPMNVKPELNGKRTILVIDDNEIILKTTSMMLQNRGYHVFTAVSASEGVELARKKKPDLILLDIGFPPAAFENRVVDGFTGLTWDGFRIMDWLHKVDETKKIPIVVISGMLEVEEKNKQRASASGAVAFLPKPVNFDEMFKVISMTLDAESNVEPAAA
jgi:two-component system, cell cycle response regulator DivK